MAEVHEDIVKKYGDANGTFPAALLGTILGEVVSIAPSLPHPHSLDVTYLQMSPVHPKAKK